MNIHQVNDLFSDEELNALHNLVNISTDGGVDTRLGRSRIFINNEDIPNIVYDRLLPIVNKIAGFELKFDNAFCVEYSGRYGEPNLQPHFDGNHNDIIVDFQLSANTDWDLGVEEKNYSMKDNSALIFNANEYVHWRPYKKFNNDEYVKMIFFRYYNAKEKTDWSYLRYLKNDERLKPSINFREKLGYINNSNA